MKGVRAQILHYEATVLLFFSLLSACLVSTCLAQPATLRTTAEKQHAASTITMRDMTWMEIRAAISQGAKTVIMPTGGIEQNGPHMVLSKHDYIVSYAANSIAKSLGNTLVAPVISFVPEGDFSPPSDNMRFTGTIGITEAAFEAVLDGVGRSLKLAGFTKILILGDNGPSQATQARVAARLSRLWRGEGVQVVHIGDYYEDAKQYAQLAQLGETVESIGIHAGLIDTSELLFIAPHAVNLGHLKGINSPLETAGASGNPEKSTAELGKMLITMRIEAALKQIRAIPD